jgi:hypothetical protein
MLSGLAESTKGCRVCMGYIRALVTIPTVQLPSLPHHFFPHSATRTTPKPGLTSWPVHVGCVVPTEVSMNITIFWDVPPCSPVEVYRFLPTSCSLFGSISSTLQLEEVNFYRSTRYHIPENSNLHDLSQLWRTLIEDLFIQSSII